MKNLAKLHCAGAAIFALLPAAAMAQQSTAPTAFEVASVKPVGPVAGGPDGRGGFAGAMNGCDGSFPKIESNRFSVTTTPFALITWAYGYNKVWGCAFTSSGDLITGGPSWIRSERFEIQAIIPQVAGVVNNATNAAGQPDLQHTFSCSGLDNTYPYNLGTANNVDDSPAVALVVGDQQDSVSEMFQMFLMFNPGTPNSIWVPVVVVPWSWSANASSGDGGNTWGFVQPAKTAMPNGVAVGNATAIPPVWNRPCVNGKMQL